MFFMATEQFMGKDKILSVFLFGLIQVVHW